MGSVTHRPESRLATATTQPHIHQAVVIIGCEKKTHSNGKKFEFGAVKIGGE